jgi:hypothetical protein
MLHLSPGSREQQVQPATGSLSIYDSLLILVEVRATFKQHDAPTYTALMPPQ